MIDISFKRIANIFRLSALLQGVAVCSVYINSQYYYRFIYMYLIDTTRIKQVLRGIQMTPTTVVFTVVDYIHGYHTIINISIMSIDQ